MHNCRRIESQFVDLLFDDMDAAHKRRLLTEIEGCANCASQYQSLSDTLFVFDQSAQAAEPVENYWPRYTAALRQRLLSTLPAMSENNNSRASFWQRLLTAKIRIPVPVAAALVIGLIISSAMALRRTPVAQTNAAPSSPIIESVRIIEVPVAREKIVTRIVYVEKKQQRAAGRESPGKLPSIASAGETSDSTVAHSKPEDETGFFTRANLKGFQPPDEMKIRVIKRNNTDEK